MNYFDVALPPMPPILRAGSDRPAKTNFDHDAALSECLASAAAVEKAQISKRRNDAVLASAPDSVEVGTILAERVYRKTVKKRSKARGFKSPRRRR